MAGDMPAASGRSRASRLLRRGLRIHWDLQLIISGTVLAAVVVSAVFGAWLAPYNPYELHPADLLTGPSGAYWLGTDEFGRDLFSRIIDGSRSALLISVVSVVLATAAGVPLGLIAGYYGGITDTVLMRVQDALLAFPVILFAILMVAAFGASAQTITVTVAVVYTPRFARLVRGVVLVLKEQEFVVASRAAGAGDLHLMFRRILPNSLPPLLVQATLAMAVAILIEAGLSYLGLGVQPPTATWGTMLRSAQSYPAQAPWYVLGPGIAIFVVVLSLYVLGDRLRDRLDPRTRGVRA